MTANVLKALNILKSLDLFETEELYFVGGTALSYYLECKMKLSISRKKNRNR